MRMYSQTSLIWSSQLRTSFIVWTPFWSMAKAVGEGGGHLHTARLLLHE